MRTNEVGAAGCRRCGPWVSQRLWQAPTLDLDQSGTITVRWPRVRDLNERFVSRVLPLFKRQTKEVGELLPQLYLHGLALGDFELALRGLLGEGAPLSPASLLRLKTQWQLEYEMWKQRRLDDLEVVYIWADGLYVKAGLEDTRAALLVMIGVLTKLIWKLLMIFDNRIR
jgi:putative transposase